MNEPLEAARNAPQVPVIDRRCFCDRCSHEPGYYDKSAKCHNCGTSFVARYRKGDKAWAYNLECPACKVTGSVMFTGVVFVGEDEPQERENQ